MSSENTQIPLPLLVMMGFFAVVIVGAFSLALRGFLKAGRRDAEERRRRLGAHAKDPLDPRLEEHD